MEVYPRLPYIVEFPYENSERYSIAVELADSADQHTVLFSEERTLHRCIFGERNIAVAAAICSLIDTGGYGHYNGAISISDLDQINRDINWHGKRNELNDAQVEAYETVRQKIGGEKNIFGWILEKQRENQEKFSALYQWFDRNNLDLTKIVGNDPETILSQVQLSVESKVRAYIIDDEYKKALEIIETELSEDQQKEYRKEVLYLRVVLLNFAPTANDIKFFSRVQDVNLINCEEGLKDIDPFLTEAANNWRSEDAYSLKAWLRICIPTVRELLLRRKEKEPQITYRDLGENDGVLFGRLFPCYPDPLFHTRKSEYKNNIWKQSYADLVKSRNSKKPLSKLPSVVSEILRLAIDEWRESKGLPRIGQGWVSETLLFNVFKNRFKDAIQHYHASWLGRQHLDIYIPSLDTAVEYQGLQHYESVDIFGGESGLKQTKRRDKLKKGKCKKHGVLLLDWKYDRAINDAELVNLLKEHDIISLD